MAEQHRIYYDKDYILQHGDFRTVVEQLGIEVYQKGHVPLIYCPNPEHNDSHLGNCVVYPEACYCFSCQKRYNMISLVQEVKGLSFVDALAWLADVFGISSPETNTSYKEYHPQKGFISSSDRQFLGIEIKPLMALKPRPLEELLEENRKAQNGEVWGRDYREMREECISKNPLLDWFLNDPEGYHAFIRGKTYDKLKSCRINFRYNNIVAKTEEERQENRIEYEDNVAHCKKILRENSEDL